MLNSENFDLNTHKTGKAWEKKPPVDFIGERRSFLLFVFV